MIEGDCTGDELRLQQQVSLNYSRANRVVYNIHQQMSATSSINSMPSSNYVNINKSSAASTSMASLIGPPIGLGFVDEHQQQQHHQQHQSAVGNFGLNMFSHPQSTPMNFGCFNLFPSCLDPNNLNSFIQSPQPSTQQQQQQSSSSHQQQQSSNDNSSFGLNNKKVSTSTKRKRAKKPKNSTAANNNYELQQQQSMTSLTAPTMVPVVNNATVKPRRRLRHYSLAEKLMAVEMAEKTSNNQAARHFTVDRKCIREWRKAKDKLISACNSTNPDDGHRKRQRGGGKKPMSGELEHRLLTWIVHELNNTNATAASATSLARLNDANNIVGSSLITSRILKLKAVEIYNELKESGIVTMNNNEDFKASDGWLEKFLKRHSSSFSGVGDFIGGGGGRSSNINKVKFEELPTDDM